MAAILEPIVGLASLGVALLLWVGRSQLVKTKERVEAELAQVPLTDDNRLAPNSSRAMTGSLRSGLVQRRNKLTGQADVVATYVLSDDALIH
jgi:hypothetical protein